MSKAFNSSFIPKEQENLGPISSANITGPASWGSSAMHIEPSEQDIDELFGEPIHFYNTSKNSIKDLASSSAFEPDNNNTSYEFRRNLAIYKQNLENRPIQDDTVSEDNTSVVNASGSKYTGPGKYINKGIRQYSGPGSLNKSTGISGNKATRNNNPFNISGLGGKLLYGAKGFSYSKHGDKGDQKMLYYASAEDGVKAGVKLMSSNRYNNKPIAQAFKKYQTNQKAFGNMLTKYRKLGIDVDNKTFNQLTNSQKYDFMAVRAEHEGFSGVLPNPYSK